MTNKEEDIIMNRVHFERERELNKIVTSKEEILHASRALIQKQGWKAINIRTVAKECNISIGSVYNYFENKADLITATVESVWYDIFHLSENMFSFDDFSCCIAWVFSSMKKGEERYPGFFTLHSMSFMEEEKSSGQERMAQSWLHIKKGLYCVLLHDPKVKADAFDESFTQEKFIDIIFSLILSALIRRDYDCSGITGMIRRVLYG